MWESSSINSLLLLLDSILLAMIHTYIDKTKGKLDIVGINILNFFTSVMKVKGRKKKKCKLEIAWKMSDTVICILQI